MRHSIGRSGLSGEGARGAPLSENSKEAIKYSEKINSEMQEEEGRVGGKRRNSSRGKTQGSESGALRQKRQKHSSPVEDGRPVSGRGRSAYDKEEKIPPCTGSRWMKT